VVSGSQSGTYTINCDGSGVITRLVTLSSGQASTVVSDFIITKAVRIRSDNCVLIATALEDAQNPELHCPWRCLFDPYLYAAAERG
jgi:hypothetical protein